jgi:hypothetical protein
MKFAIFGLTVSCSWGNGHATLWRGLINALTRHGQEVVFFERDVAYYAENCDLHELPRRRVGVADRWPTLGQCRQSSNQSSPVRLTNLLKRLGLPWAVLS